MRTCSGHAAIIDITKSFQRCNSTSGKKGARLASETSWVARFERNIARLWETAGIPLVTVLVLLSFVFSCFLTNQGVWRSMSKSDSLLILSVLFLLARTSMHIISLWTSVHSKLQVWKPASRAARTKPSIYQEQWCFGCWTWPVKSHLKVTLQHRIHIPPLPSAAAQSPKAPLCDKEETPLPVDTTSDSPSPIISTSKNVTKSHLASRVASFIVTQISYKYGVPVSLTLTIKI